MWIIIELTGSAAKYNLLTEKEYVVGRKDADILVPSDPSISRKHAVLTVSFNDSSRPHEQPVLTIKDVSKFGTHVGGVCIKKGDKVITSGDVIVFGTTGNNKYKAIYEPYILTTSCISGPFKKSVKSMVNKLGGHTVNDWRRDCQLLVMSSLNVTIKVICALVSLKPIVTPQYLEDLIKAIETNGTLPNPEHYHPPLAESQLDQDSVSFNPVKDRQTLFQGKIFIFLSPKQFKKLSTAIELAGGTPMVMEEGTDNNEDDILIAPHTCVMLCDPSDATQMSQNGQQWINHVLSFLKKNKKRPITDPEIGYAVLYCSTEDNCNPDKELPPSNVCKPDGVAQSLSQLQPQHSQLQRPEVLVQDTELDVTLQKKIKHSSKGDVTHVDETKMNIIIKEEPVSQCVSQSTKKQLVRKRQQEETVTKTDVVEHPTSKRQILEVPLKEEVFTPQDTHQSTSQSRPTTSRDRRLSPVPDTTPTTRLRDEAASNSSSRVTRSRSRSPVPGIEPRSTRSHSPVPGPRPATTVSGKNTGEKKSIKKREVMNMNHVEDFDGIPDRKTRKRNNKVTEEVSMETKKSNPAENIEAFDQDFEVDSIIADIDTSVDDFDAVPSRKSRNREDATDFDAIPSRKSRKKEVQKENTQSSSSEMKDVMENKPRIKTEPTCESDRAILVYDTTPSETRKVHQTTKPEVQHSQNTDKATDSFHPDVVKNESSNDSTQSTGFLSTRRPIEEQRVRISEFSTKEENLPISCALLADKSLLARKPGHVRDKVVIQEGNYCTWKGRKVKNFKNFRKVTPMLLDGLPTIIGGSDLVVHESKPREELEEWFRDEMQAESQQNEMDKMAMELFDYEPPTRKRRH